MPGILLHKTSWGDWVNMGKFGAEALVGAALGLALYYLLSERGTHDGGLWPLLFFVGGGILGAAANLALTQ